MYVHIPNKLLFIYTYIDVCVDMYIHIIILYIYVYAYVSRDEHRILCPLHAQCKQAQRWRLLLDYEGTLQTGARAWERVLQEPH